MRRNSSKLSRQRGMTLLEVLIAVVILAIGLLGIGALQSRGQQVNVAAQVRTYATFLATQMMERMRINRGASESGYYDVDAAAYAVQNCRTASCSTSQLRNYDLFEWTKEVAKNLPGGVGRVDYYDATYATLALRNRYRISISWDLRDMEQEEGGPTTKTMSWVVTP